ncbi:MAG: TIGR01777 family oxidoreductase [Bacteroidota bacterium]
MSTHIILIAGGSGFIGSHIINTYKHMYTFRILTRSNQSTIHDCDAFHWNPKNGTYDEAAFKNVTTIINLSGENISAKRWSRNQKKNILSSRTTPLLTLYNACEKHGSSVKQLISSSATGFYGSAFSNNVFHEDSPQGDDFLASVCAQWEEHAKQFKKLHIKTTIIRTGIVFDSHSGAFPQMIRTLPYYFVVVPGNGKQYVPWIHISDLAALYMYTIQKNLHGTFNAVAQTNTQYKDIIFSIKKITGCFAFHIPQILLQILLGEMSVIITKGNKISNEKIKTHGFSFTYSDLHTTLKSLL